MSGERPKDPDQPHCIERIDRNGAVYFRSTRLHTLGASHLFTTRLGTSAGPNLQWDMGFKLLLLIFAAVVLGGLGTAYGAMVGGFIVGITVEMSTLIFPNELKTAVGLVLLIVILLVKPQGLLGTKERIG